MANSNKWNSWLFTTAKTWSEGQLELPVLDLQSANTINNSIMERLFELKNIFNRSLVNITPEKSQQLKITLNVTHQHLNNLLNEKIALIEEINEKKKFQYSQLKQDIDDHLNNTLNYYKAGLFNKSINTCSTTLVTYLEFIELNDIKNFSINEFIKLIDFTNNDSFKKYVSFNTFPSIKRKQILLISSICQFHIHFTRRSDDFFTLEELFKNVINSLKILTQEERNISEKFDFNAGEKNSEDLATIEKRVINIKDKLKYRTKLEKNELIHLYHGIIYHINQTIYAKIATKNIATDYFSGFKEYEQVSELFSLPESLNNIAKNTFTHLLLSFKTTPALAIKELDESLSQVNKIESFLNLNSEGKDEKMIQNINTLTNQFKLNIQDYITFIKKSGELKSSEYKNYLLKSFSLCLMEVSSEGK